MVLVLVVIVGVAIMDNPKKEKHFMDSLENHTIPKSTSQMDEKLNNAKKNLKGKSC